MPLAQPVGAWAAAWRSVVIVSVLGFLLGFSGCWTPFYAPATSACDLPDFYRMPVRTAGPPLNYANLTLAPTPDYLLGPNDVLEVTVPGLYVGAEIRPLRVQVMANGEIYLPLVGALRVGDKNLLQAQQAITAAYAAGFLVDPRVSINLAEKATISVLVLGKVQKPGVHLLPKNENDVGHALAAAGGLTDDAADIIEKHSRVPAAKANENELVEPNATGTLQPFIRSDDDPDDPKEVVEIPLRGLEASAIDPRHVVLNTGDVVVVPSRRHEVFYVVGKIGQNTTARFTIGDRERELGIGFVLPRDREIDVVTAVAMAGYIDPIDSPSTVTVHRHEPDGTSTLIRVDLIEARYDPRNNVLVWPGDIIYLNPDSRWWFRRTFDRVVPNLIVLPYSRSLGFR